VALAPAGLCLALLLVQVACAFRTLGRLFRDAAPSLQRARALLCEGASPGFQRAAWSKGLTSDPAWKTMKEMELAHRLAGLRRVLPAIFILTTILFINDFLLNRRWHLIVRSLSGLGGPADEAASNELALWLGVALRQIIPMMAFHVPCSLRGLRFLVCCGFARLAWECSWVDDADSVSWMAASAPARMALCIILGEIPLTTLLNLTLSVYAVRRHCGVGDVHLNIIVCLTTLCVTLVFNFASESMVKSMLEAEAARGVEVAADGLLSRVCDAVVHLGEDLSITQPSPKLAALLLRSTQTGMQGVALPDLSTSQEERDRLRSFLRRPTEGADSLNTSFKGPNATTVNVRLYHIRGRHLDSKIFHVVGVSEASETEVVAASSGGSRSPSGLGSQSVCPLRALALSVSARPPARACAVQLKEVTTVYFHPMESGYPIVASARSGLPAPGDSLLSWMPGSADEFIEMVQQVVTEWHMHRATHPRRFARLLLRPPRARQTWTELRADAELTMDHNAEGAAAGVWTVRATLRGMEEVQRQRGQGTLGTPPLAGARPAARTWSSRSGARSRWPSQRPAWENPSAEAAGGRRPSPGCCARSARAGTPPAVLRGVDGAAGPG